MVCRSAYLDLAGAQQHVVGPECDRLVAHLPPKGDAFVHQPCAETLPARRRLDQQQPQLGHRGRLLDKKDAPDTPGALLGDPASLVLGGIVLNERADNLLFDR